LDLAEAFRLDPLELLGDGGLSIAHTWRLVRLVRRELELDTLVTETLPRKVAEPFRSRLLPSG
jgi:hypothetical protein